jgi:hypothetical protein
MLNMIIVKVVLLEKFEIYIIKIHLINSYLIE